MDYARVVDLLAQVGQQSKAPGAPSDHSLVQETDEAVERLARENRRLRSALVNIAASFPIAGDGIWSLHRRRELWRDLAEQCGEESWHGWAHALCVAATEAMPDVLGVAVSGYDDGRPHVLAATSEWTRRMEEIHQLVGEGPAIDAYRAQSPVVVAHLPDEQERWPGYLAAAAGSALGRLCALPVSLGGAPVATLTLYLREDVSAELPQWLDGLYVASAVAMCMLVDLDVEDNTCLAEAWDDRVMVATGIVAEQLAVHVDVALLHMRAFAFGNALGLTEVADAVLDGSLRLS